MGQIEQHTPEPWSIDKDMAEPCNMRFYAISGADGNAAALTMYDGGVEARRIVAAINFCAGRSTEWLEPGGDGMTIYEGLDTIATDRVLLEAERDALQARLDALVAAVGPLLDHAVEHEEMCSDVAAGDSCWIHNAAENARAAIEVDTV